MNSVSHSNQTRARMTALVVLATAILSSLLVVHTAKASNDGNASVSGPEGTWLVSVSVEGAPPGFPVPFDALETYSRGGGVMTSNNNPLIPRPGQGTWTRNRDEYAVSIIFFFFDPLGAPAGTVEVTHRFQIEGSGYRGAGEAQFKNLAGDPLFPEHPQPFSFTTQGKRVTAP